MFDNPKKELERLEQQLLAAEQRDALEEEENLFLEDTDDFYDDLSSRSTGFGIDEEYIMDTDRYVPAKRKSMGGLVFFALLLAVSATALALWALGQLL